MATNITERGPCGWFCLEKWLERFYWVIFHSLILSLCVCWIQEKNGQRVFLRSRKHVKWACDGVELFRDVPVTRWMTNGCLKTVLSGLLPLPGDTGGRPSVPFSHIILLVLIYRLWRHTTVTPSNLRRAFLLREVSLLIPSVSWGRRRLNRQSIKLLPKLSVLKK